MTENNIVDLMFGSGVMLSGSEWPCGQTVIGSFLK